MMTSTVTAIQTMPPIAIPPISKMLNLGEISSRGRLPAGRFSSDTEPLPM